MPHAFSITDRMLAEAVRALERDGKAPLADDAAATAAGRTSGGRAGDLEAKIIARAKATSVAAELATGVRRFEATATWLAVAFMVLMALLGAGAVRATLGVGAESRVNFFLALGTLLGVQTIVLLVWMLFTVWRPGAASVFSVGGLLRWLVDGIMRRASRSPTQIGAMEGAAVVNASPRIARWTLSTLSHGAWLSFNFGCIAALLVLLSTRHYTFVWETTILSERAYAPMVEALAQAPRAAGFATPTEEQVAASQWTGEANAAGDSSESARQAWAGLLVGSIVVYGVLPRFVLLVLSAWRLRAARRGYRLDLTSPGFAALAARLSPRQQSLGVIDADTGKPSDAHSERGAKPSARPMGPPAIVGIEMRQPRVWPPRLDGIALHDLGILNDRPDRQRVIHELHTAAQEPATLVIACSLISTPDRGLGAIIAQLRAAVSRPAIALLTGGQALRERTDAAALGRRVEDWRRLATDAGVQADNILELDLDHATHTSLTRLAHLLRASIDGGAAPYATSAREPIRRIERAFNFIVEHAERWHGAPDHRQQALLHQDILRLYGDQPAQWSSLLGSPGSISELSIDTARTLRSNAGRALQLLPAHVRVRPAWAVAGATAGAIGCIAAAMLAAPAAIGALPLWSVVGGAIAAAASAMLKRTPEEFAAEVDESAMADAVRAATLSALLLELQGRSEQAISRVLDRVLSGPGIEVDAPLDSVDDVRDWLEQVRHRYDLAITAETSI
jgi:hypothetical protein